MVRALLLSATLLLWAGAMPPTACAQVDPLEAEAVRIYEMLPRHSTILQLPGVESWSSYGTEGVREVKAEGVPGGRAKRFRVAKAGANAWDSALQFPNAVDVKPGEVVHASFWARAAKLPKGEAKARIPVSLQKNGEPYTQVAYAEVALSEDWELHTLAGKASEPYGLGGMVLNLQVATGAQTLEMGPVFLNSLGPGAVPGEMAEKTAAPEAAAGPVAQVRPSDLPEAVRKDLDALMARLPSGARLMSDPRVSAEGAYGGEARQVEDRGVPGGTALEVRTDRPRENSWDVGVNLPITEAVAEGDVLLLAVWAKAVEARNESQTAVMQPIRIQESGGAYASAVEGAAYLSRDWELYFIPAKANTGFAAGPSGITYHLGLTPQTVRIGPSYLLKMPAGTDVQSLPKNEIDYAGRAPDAPWRQAAMARIDRHRKADLAVRVVDGSGRAVPGAQVRVKQEGHAFHFGTFTGHKFTAPTTADERQAHRIIEESFNTLTLPIYWADWGWAGPGSKEDDYKASIRYANARGIPWRAHTVMWPGERYMPSRMLAAMSPKARRALVTSHIEEVVTFIRDADLAPFAVDFTNEPRANRYFQDNGDPDLVADMFRHAHTLAPDLPLFVNDYAILNNGGLNQSAIDYYHQWLREMRSQGVPVGGIGFQGHFSAGLTPPERFIDILEGFSTYDLPLHITEFDVESLDEAAQADYTRDAVLAALSVPSVEAFVFWGFWEGDHWKPNAAMIREDWTPKPAYVAWRKLVFEDLWTDTTLTTGEDGTARIRAMQGDYTVSVDGVGSEVSLDADGETLTLTVGG